MPSNITHMLICHKAIERFGNLEPKNKKIAKQLKNFAKELEDKSRKRIKVGHSIRPYLNLGSLGPDMFCYQNGMTVAKSFFAEGHIGAAGVEPWAYHLHSVRPNEFPLKLLEILFRDVNRDASKNLPRLEFQDSAKLAFIIGYLTHIAADQIIHPSVNKIAGPYYRAGKNRVSHRKCEVFQDYFLYQTVYEEEGKLNSGKHDFFAQEFGDWCDCIKGYTFDNTEDWFRSFIQRGFAETYGNFPKDNEIEDAADGIIRVLSICNASIGPLHTPYREAEKAWKKRKKKDKGLYGKYFIDTDYMTLYREAVELATTYILAAFEAWIILKGSEDFNQIACKRFEEVVSSADLGTPLISSSILDGAIANLKRPPSKDEHRPDWHHISGVTLKKSSTIKRQRKKTNLL